MAAVSNRFQPLLAETEPGSSNSPNLVALQGRLRRPCNQIPTQPTGSQVRPNSQGEAEQLPPAVRTYLNLGQKHSNLTRQLHILEANNEKGLVTKGFFSHSPLSPAIVQGNDLALDQLSTQIAKLELEFASKQQTQLIYYYENAVAILEGQMRKAYFEIPDGLYTDTQLRELLKTQLDKTKSKDKPPPPSQATWLERLKTNCLQRFKGPQSASKKITQPRLMQPRPPAPIQKRCQPEPAKIPELLQGWTVVSHNHRKPKKAIVPLANLNNFSLLSSSYKQYLIRKMARLTYTKKIQQPITIAAQPKLQRLNKQVNQVEPPPNQLQSETTHQAPPQVQPTQASPNKSQPNPIQPNPIQTSPSKTQPNPVSSPTKQIAPWVPIISNDTVEKALVRPVKKAKKQPETTSLLSTKLPKSFNFYGTKKPTTLLARPGFKRPLPGKAIFGRNSLSPPQKRQFLIDAVKTAQQPPKKTIPNPKGINQFSITKNTDPKQTQLNIPTTSQKN